MKKRFSLISFFLLLFLASQISLGLAQTNIGQYEDEAPLQSWNQFGLTTAPSLALGMTKIVFPLNNSISLTNPSLLAKLPDLTLTFNGSFLHTSLHRYGLVNTGVLLTQDNLTTNLSALDYGGLSLRIKGWIIGISVGLLEYYDRPRVDLQKDYQGRTYYKLNYDQQGLLRNFNLAVARPISSRLLIGLGFNLVRGNWERQVKEEWLISQITLQDIRQESYRGFYLNGGLTFLFNDHLWASLVFRSPFKKKANGESELSYTATLYQTNIKISAQAENYYQQPLVLGGGFYWEFNPFGRLLSEVTYYRWSDYQVHFFDEDLVRNFKDTVQLATGIEYQLTSQLLGTSAQFPLRLGFFLDTQPMRTEKSSYLGITLGTGLHWSHLYLDVGLALAKKRGGESSLSANRVGVTLSYNH